MLCCHNGIAAIPHVASIWQPPPSGLTLRRKYSKFSYVLCLLRLSPGENAPGPTKHYTKIYHGDNARNYSLYTRPQDEPIARFSLSQYPHCNLAAFFTVLIQYDNCLWSAKHNKQFPEIKLIIFLSFSGWATNNCTLWIKTRFLPARVERKAFSGNFGAKTKKLGVSGFDLLGWNVGFLESGVFEQSFFCCKTRH